MNKLKTIWNNMKARCKRPTGKNKCYQQISYTEEWEHFASFKEWALKSGYKEGLSIDRIDSTKNYEPSNCRWIPLKRQARNKKGFGLSSFKGVVASKVKSHPWKAQICIENNHIDLGCYKTEKGAAYAYNQYCIQNNIEYSYLNNVTDNDKEAPYVRQTKSKYTGVHYNKSSKINPWQARYATFKSKEVLIGCFNTEEEATKARDEYVIKHNLKVRRMNFV